MSNDIDWVWGVDVATKKIALAFLPLEPETARPQANCVAIDPTTSAELPSRLVQTVERTQSFVENMRGFKPPVAVHVEQPVGRFPAPALVAAWGATLIALRQGLPAGLLIYSSTPKNWMDDLGIRARRGTKEPQLCFAQTLGYAGQDDDEADAFCIAESARRKVAAALDTGRAIAA